MNLPGWFGKSNSAVPPVVAPAASVTAPVRPMVGVGTFVLMGIAFIGLLVWMTAKDFKSASGPTVAPVKTTGAGIVTNEPPSRFRPSPVASPLEPPESALDRQNRLLAGMNQTTTGTTGTGSTGTPEIKTDQDREKERMERERERISKARFASAVIPPPEVETAKSAAASPAPAPAAAAPVGHSDAMPTEPPARPAPAAAPAERSAPVQKSDERHDCKDLREGTETMYAVCEGTPFMAVTQFRVVGDFAGPVKAVLEEDIYSRDKQHLLLPKGTEFIGEASMVEQAFQQRLKTSFHRILFRDGRGYVLDGAPALEAAGDMALKDKTNRHLASTFTAAILMGGLAGFAQAGTGGYLSASGMDMYRQGVSQQLGQTGQQVVGRQLNRPPTLTIREGHHIIIYLRQDLHVPEYLPTVTTSFERGK